MTEVMERRVDAPMATRALVLAPETWNAEARTVDVTFTTGARGARFSWTRWELIDEELATEPANVRLDRLNNGAAVLNTHDQFELGDQIGVVVPGSARMEGGQGVATLQLSGRDEIAGIVADIAAGIIRNISVGYLVHTYEVTEKDGERALYRAVDWEPTEISFVPVPFDAGAQVRSRETAQGGHPCIIRRAGAASEENDMTTTASTQPASSGAAVEPQAGATVPPSSPETRASVAAFTATDALAFVSMARAFGEPMAVRANELVQRNASGEISVETARSTILQEAAEAQRAQTGGISTGGRNIEMGMDEREKFQRGASNAILTRAGLAGLVRKAADQRGEKRDMDPGEFAGVSLVELARMTIENAGESVQGRRGQDIVAQAISLRRSGGYQSTSDFANLLDSTMHVTLQSAYLVAPDTWSRFCGIGSVGDFRPHYRLLKGTLGVLDALTENGEFKRKAIPDAVKEMISASTKGNIIALTRQAIVNDDLSAFSDLMTEAGRAGKLSIEKDVYAVLAQNSGLGPDMNDSKSLFHADHNNIAATGAAPSVDSIGAIRNLMGAQKDVSGNEVLDISPAIFLGPRALADKAKVVNTSEYDPDTANKLQRANIERGTFTDIIGTARLTGTRWYAFADPALNPAIEVVFLDGQQEPFLDMSEGWDVDGTEYKVRHDYGVGAINWRSAATNAGA